MHPDPTPPAVPPPSADDLARDLENDYISAQWFAAHATAGGGKWAAAVRLAAHYRAEVARLRAELEEFRRVIP
jgi:hypothetical protein